MRASQKVTDRVSILLDQTVVQTLQETREITSVVGETQSGIRGIGGKISIVQTSQRQIEQRSIARDELIIERLEALGNKSRDDNLILTDEIRRLQTLLYNIVGESGCLTATKQIDQGKGI